MYSVLAISIQQQILSTEAIGRLADERDKCVVEGDEKEDEIRVGEVDKTFELCFVNSMHFEARL